MTDFQQFLNQLLDHPSTSTKISVNGVTRCIKAFVHLTAKNYLADNGEYYKILFDDGAFMLIIPAEEEIYFAPSLISHIVEIPDKDIGVKEEIEYKSKKYRLDNKMDYQYVLQLLVGSPLEIEGECRFSDYLPISGPKEFLSLGWLSSTGQRADINCQIIDNKFVNLEL